MKRWKIKAYLPGGIGMPMYDGYVEAYGEDEETAVEDGKRKIRRTHGNREIRIEEVKRIYA